MYFIESKRLKLIPLSHSQLKQLSDSRKSLELSLGLEPSEMLIDPEFESEIADALANFWLPETLNNPDKFKWFTTWEIVLKSDRISIGGIGFAGWPANGEAEIGFMLDKKHHYNGYAGEALNLMSEWAFECPDVTTLIAHTYSHNLAACKLLEKCGFVVGGKEGDLLTYRKD